MIHDGTALQKFFIRSLLVLTIILTLPLVFIQYIICTVRNDPEKVDEAS